MRARYPIEPLFDVSSAVQFTADPDDPQAWLNSLLAIWDGGFDMETGQHPYRAYARSARED
jgi:hypothetical protein